MVWEAGFLSQKCKRADFSFCLDMMPEMDGFGV